MDKIEELRRAKVLSPIRAKPFGATKQPKSFAIRTTQAAACFDYVTLVGATNPRALSILSPLALIPLFIMRQSTSSHPPRNRPDATENTGQSPSDAPSSSELPSLKIRLHKALRQFPDFPSPGILFEDILPIFNDPSLHEALIRALELHIKSNYNEGQRPDVIVGLEARGFLFGPSLALRLGASFVPVRKQGKLPGPTETASYEKEYGQDFFQIQADAIKQGQQVLVVDDIIATGMVENGILQFSIDTNVLHRRICCCCRIVSEETGRDTTRLHLHPRTRFPQGS